jgi:uncharacterized membrane protein YkoI
MRARTLWVGLVLLTLASTGRAAELTREIAEKIKELAPGAEITRFRPKTRGGAQVYEIRVEFADGRDGRMELTAELAVRRLDMEITEASLPEPVRAAALKLYPGAEFDKAKRITRDGRTVFEVQYKDEDRDLEAVFGADGALIERKDELDEGDLPDKVLDKIAADHPGARIRRARRRFEDGRDFVEVEIEVHFELRLPDPQGTRTEVRRIRGDELPPAVREAARDALGEDFGDVRFIERTTAPVTVYETEVRRREDVEIDLDAGDAVGPKPAGGGGPRPEDAAGPAKDGAVF